MSAWKPRTAGADHQAGRQRRAAHHARLDRLVVDRLVEGAAHAHVLERVLALDAAELQLVALLVHAEEDRAQLGALQHVQMPADLIRSTSCSGTGSITSISPDSSAATRVASLPIGVKTISSTLPSALPHQLKFLHQHRAHRRLALLQPERAGAVRLEAGRVLDPLAAVDRALGLVLLAPLLAHHRRASSACRAGSDTARWSRSRPRGRRPCAPP